MIQFEEENHKYTSLPGKKAIDWISVTKIIGAVCPPFDAEKQAVKSSRNRKSKWYNMLPRDIKAAWDAENKRSTDLGHWYHNKREKEFIGKPGVIMPQMEGKRKVASSQRLVSGIYPEHMVYLESAGVCGQSDLATIEADKYLDVDDWKSNKEIKMKGYTNWEGVTTKMLGPVAHLDDCEFNHYALQLSIYAFIITRHNPSLTVRRMGIHHVQFEEAGRNEHDYPIHLLDEHNEPVVKGVTYHEIPYMKTEASALIEYAKKNRTTILKSKH